MGDLADYSAEHGRTWHGEDRDDVLDGNPETLGLYRLSEILGLLDSSYLTGRLLSLTVATESIQTGLPLHSSVVLAKVTVGS